MQAVETSEVTDLLVGITPAYLNTFLQRKLYGIRASVQKGKVRKKRRLFSEADVFGVALVWMLFESGLRTRAIRRILNELAGTKTADARVAAEALRKSAAEYIVIVREPRKPKGPTEPQPEIRTAKKIELAGIVADNATANVLLIPVGQKFEDVRKRMEVLL
jgi:hypothetical protein